LIGTLPLSDSELTERFPTNDDIDDPLARRADRQPGSPALSSRLTRKESHDNRMMRFRDLILDRLVVHCSQDILERFDFRSRNLTGSLPENSERALFSDLEQFSQFCAEHSHTIFPIKGYVLDHYLSYLMGANKSRSTIERLGLSPHVFSGHSTRIGAAQEMAERNIEAYKIMLSGRWKDMRMVTRYTKKLNAKRSGTADLTRSLGWDQPISKALDKV